MLLKEKAGAVRTLASAGYETSLDGLRIDQTRDGDVIFCPIGRRDGDMFIE